MRTGVIPSTTPIMASLLSRNNRMLTRIDFLLIAPPFKGVTTSVNTPSRGELSQTSLPTNQRVCHIRMDNSNKRNHIQAIRRFRSSSNSNSRRCITIIIMMRMWVMKRRILMEVKVIRKGISFRRMLSRWLIRLLVSLEHLLIEARMLVRRRCLILRGCLLVSLFVWISSSYSR